MHRLTESDFLIRCHNVKMASFDAEKCCHLVSVHTANLYHLCGSIHQFLIYIVFVHVFFRKSGIQIFGIFFNGLLCSGSVSSFVNYWTAYQSD